MNDKEIDKISNVILDNEIEAIIISNTSDSSRDKFEKYSKPSKRRFIW